MCPLFEGEELQRRGEKSHKVLTLEAEGQTESADGFLMTHTRSGDINDLLTKAHFILFGGKGTSVRGVTF